MKLTGVCGHSCLMYCCSPHRISWMTRGGHWVFHHKFTQFFTQSVSLVSQQPHFGVVRCGPIYMPYPIFRTQQFDTLVSLAEILSHFHEVVITTREVETVLRSSAEYFLFFDKRAIPLARADLGRRRRR